MITFSKLGNKGNLGNQLFQIASMLSAGENNKHEVIFPEWKWNKYLKNPIKTGAINNSTLIKEKYFHFENIILPDAESNYDFDGWYQSEKYFIRGLVKKTFEFSDDLTDKLKKTYKDLFSKKTILISIRRGDFVGNSNYYQLDINYYLSCLVLNFEDWKDYNLLITSDDLEYAKHHFSCVDNAYFPDGLNAMEQLCLGSMCDHFIISNSTFSWWQAWLGEKKTSKIYRPIKNFDGSLAKNNDESDFFPERWSIHETKKIGLMDTTFIVPVHFDHKDRKKNTDLSICMVQRTFDTKVVVGEQGSHVFGYTKLFASYRKFNNMARFHRTKMLNDMIKDADTEYVVNWDCDTFLPPLQIYLSVLELRSGADIVYPFDGRVYHVPRAQNFEQLEKSLDTGIYGLNTFLGKSGKEVISSVGHAVFYNKKSFIESGMENEYMISYAPEDCERWDRFHILGYIVKRISGPMYHMMHYRGIDSSNNNPFFRKNWQEYDKVRKMNKEQLKEYVKTWEWLN